MDEELRAKLKQILKDSIKGFFSRKLQKNSGNTNILDTLFPRERHIRSLIGGLETSMGTTVWERIAKELAINNGFEVIPNKQILMPKPYPQELSKIVASLLENREDKFVGTDYCIEEIRKVCRTIDFSNRNFVNPPKGQGVDIYLKKDNIEYIFDTKSPKSNVGNFSRYSKQLLFWHACRLSKDPDVELRARIAFTFNPFKGDFYESQKTKIANHLDPTHDIFVENEFWDFCSGITNTSNIFHSLFKELRNEKFHEQFDEIFYGNVGQMSIFTETCSKTEKITI